MSGTVVGVVDCLHDSALVAAAADRQQNGFINVYDFMQRNVTVGNATLHASNFGSGGTGFDYHDGVNPAGENAWAVFKFLASASTVRTTDFYVLIQYAEFAGFGAAPGDPGELDGDSGFDDGVGIMMAYREDNGDPWNGTTLANGADTKGTPVWAGTGLHVLSEINETGASSTNKESCDQLFDPGSGTPSRIWCIGDADGMIFMEDGANDNTLNNVLYLGVYTPRADLTIPNPYVMIDNFNVTSTEFTRNNESGVMSVTQSRGVVGLITHRPEISLFADNETLTGSNTRLDFPIYVRRPQAQDAVEYGLLGYIPPNLMRVNYGMPNFSTSAAFDRAYMGQSGSLGTYKFSLAYGGGAAPGLAPDRDGVVF